jgi:DNA-binding LacI/PurR family transcriptional regulator/anti-anti-sigma regulatory factor
LSKNCIGVYTSYLGGHFFGKILEAIREFLQPLGIGLVVIQGRSYDFPSQLAWDQVDGWIVVQKQPGLPTLTRHGRPMVTISFHEASLGCPGVMPDNYGGTLAATRHLLDHGHQRIAFAGPIEITDMRERYEGYVAALTERGLEPDPRLLFSHKLDRTLRASGEQIAEQMIAQGLPCTACVAACDETSFGMSKVLQSAGYRIPEDLALVGFDDVSASQYTNPPLSTVRQQPSMLGRTATKLLLDMIGGADVHTGIHRVPVSLIRRRSCGCSLGGSDLAASPSYSGAGWPDQLAHDLKLRLIFPSTPEDDGMPATGWPGALVLAQGLEAAVEARPPLPPQTIERAWQQALTVSTDIELLHAVTSLLRRAGGQKIDTQGGDPAVRRRVEDYLGLAERALMRIHALNESERTDYLERMLNASSEASTHLLGVTTGSTQRLAWLDRLPLRWGVLARWSGPEGPGRELTVVGSYARDEHAAPPTGTHLARAFPPAQTLAATKQPGEEILALFPIHVAGQEWGILALYGSLETQRSAAVEMLGLAADWLSAALEREQLLTVVADQRETLLEIGSPVIPLMPGVLLMPLVGTIDAARAQHLMQVLLQSVSEQHAAQVLLDITGVPVVDTQVAQALLSTARALTLLGARVTLVGVRAEIAQSMVSLGIDLNGISIQATLAAAVEVLLRGRFGQPEGLSGWGAAGSGRGTPSANGTSHRDAGSTRGNGAAGRR